VLTLLLFLFFCSRLFGKGGVYGAIKAAWITNPQVKDQSGPMLRMTFSLIKNHMAVLGNQTPSFCSFFFFCVLFVSHPVLKPPSVLYTRAPSAPSRPCATRGTGSTRSLPVPLRAPCLVCERRAPRSALAVRPSSALPPSLST